MTALYGVIGHPVQHSLSPVMFESAFEQYNMDASYERFDVESKDLAEFLEEMRTPQLLGGTKPVGTFGAFGAQGLTVTIPHKEAMVPFLDFVQKEAKTIGAVNTIVNAGGKLKGYNTDWLGALRALEDVTNLDGKRVVVLGAGGAAAAIVYGCLKAGAFVTVLNRHLEKANELATRFEKDFMKKIGQNSEQVQRKNDLTDRKIITGTLDEILSHPADILIHTTSIGMTPHVHQSLVPTEYFRKGMVVFDVVYNPLKTKLVQDAEAAGCRIVPGYKMLLYQAEKQFELWFKKKPPLENMEKVLLEQLQKN